MTTASPQAQCAGDLSAEQDGKWRHKQEHDQLGRAEDAQVTNLVGLLDAHTDAVGFHLNANVLNRDAVLDAMAHPEKHPQLTSASPATR